MTKYRAYNGEIERVEILRESTNTVYIDDEVFGEIYCPKIGISGNYYDSWQEAQAYLLRRARGSVELYETDLERAQSELERVKAMEQNNE